MSFNQCVLIYIFQVSIIPFMASEKKVIVMRRIKTKF